ncbi:uncharacterized protein LOC112127970 [Cimex lectularius]|uniref:Uncharacterized protein n=1 Tax=Cimex lectularius TaxID=79782 RepID=A0A8I6TMU7_CIMLE|nr:uncharacterized protein LOC112127970 [Cimex lectularius]
MKGSGWVLDKTDGLLIRINRYRPLRGSGYINIPKRISLTKSIINVNNAGDFCFKYSILSKFVRTHPGRVSSYSNMLNHYDFSCINCPTPLKDIYVFEKVNNISINVFGLESRLSMRKIMFILSKLSIVS